MFERDHKQRGTIFLKCREHILYPAILLSILFPLLVSFSVDAAESDPLSQAFGFHFRDSEGGTQSLINQLSEQLSTEPYRTDLYYRLARAYSKQGWHDKAAQYMNQWIRFSNNDMLVKDSHAFMVDEKNDRILVIDKNTRKVIRKIDVGWFPRKIVPTPKGTRLYVTNALANSVSSVDTEKMAVTNTIKAGNMPWNGKSSPQGDRVYVANLKSDNVSVIDTASDSILETVKVGQGPWGVAISPDGHRLYVSNQDSRNIQVIDTGSYNIVDVISVGTNPRDIALSPDDPGKLYAIGGDVVSDEVEIYVVDLEDARIVNALDVKDTDEPLLSRFEGMSFQEKLELLGGITKSDKETEKLIRKPSIENPPQLVTKPDSMIMSTRPVTTKDPEPKQVELPMGGPAPLMDTLLEAYVKVPSTSPVNEPMPLQEPLEKPAAKDESDSPQKAPEQEKRILRIIIVVKHDTLWRISLDNYGAAGNHVYRKIQKENPAIRDVNKIYVGQEIKLPVIYTDVEEAYAGRTVMVKRDDNLFRIAINNYGIVNEEIYAAILRANPQITDLSCIMIGQRILLPTL